MPRAASCASARCARWASSSAAGSTACSCSGRWGKAMPQDRSDDLRGLLPALFLVALATVMFEVLLTRIFSLTMWFHFAFMAISLAMFGMTVGALLVFLRPQSWPQATLKRAMGINALLLAVSMAVVIF